MPGRADTLEVRRAAERAAVPWKNGGGVTREVAVSPPGSQLSDFEWRISIAEIGAPGPFSIFPGVDRCMAILSGRLSLLIDAQPPLTLAQDGPTVAFPGDVPVFAEPLGGAVTDLNVMTRRGLCSATLTHRSAGESTVLERRDATTLLVALGELRVRSRAHAIDLAPLDALVLGEDAVRLTPRDSRGASFYVVQILR